MPNDTVTSDGWAERAKTLEAEVRRLRAQLARYNVTADHDINHPGPIFVGGTGRSGTWVVGRLFNHDPDIVTIPTELRFHASDAGFRDVLGGEETPQEFGERVRDRWYDIRGASGSVKGLCLLVARHELNLATKELVRLADDDLPRALATYMRQLVDPYALGRGATRWVETTPDNASQADTLHRVFPQSRVVHVVRDGRDVAASTIKRSWGPSTWDETFDWWEKRMRAADVATGRADPTRMLTIRLEDLVLREREKTLNSLLELVLATKPDLVRRYFESSMTTDDANVGRWRDDTDRDDSVRIDKEYRKRYRSMSDDGVSCLPIPPDAADALR